MKGYSCESESLTSGSGEAENWVTTKSALLRRREGSRREGIKRHLVQCPMALDTIGHVPTVLPGLVISAQRREQTDTARRIAEPLTKADYQIAAFGKRTPENMQAAIRAFREGSPASVVAPLMGMHRNTLDNWLDDDVEFAALVAQARADYLHDKAQSVNTASKTDGKLALALLERHPDTREQYGNTDGRRSAVPGGISITINVPIPQQVEAGQQPIIDITPENEATTDIAEG